MKILRQVAESPAISCFAIDIKCMVDVELRQPVHKAQNIFPGAGNGLRQARCIYSDSHKKSCFLCFILLRECSKICPRTNNVPPAQTHPIIFKFTRIPGNDTSAPLSSYFQMSCKIASGAIGRSLIRGGRSQQAGYIGNKT